MLATFSRMFGQFVEMFCNSWQPVNLFCNAHSFFANFEGRLMIRTFFKDRRLILRHFTSLSFPALTITLSWTPSASEHRHLFSFQNIVIIIIIFTIFITHIKIIMIFLIKCCYSPVCDDNQNLNETESETFFRYQIFPMPNPILFSIPNFFDTVSDTFFKTKFFRYRFWNHIKDWKVSKPRSFETETSPKIPQIWTKLNPKLFPIPIFFDTEY